MKFWTVQKKEIINVVDKNGIFYSDFAKSNYVKLNPNLKDLYDLVLKSFNDINNLNLKGLIFAFSQSDNQSLYEIDNFTSFYSFIQNKRAVIESLWNELSSKDAVILELNYDDNFNPIFLDISDYTIFYTPTNSFYILLCKRIRKNNRWHQKLKIINIQKYGIKIVIII